jgi:hypothetical protein
MCSHNTLMFIWVTSIFSSFLWVHFFFKGSCYVVKLASKIQSPCVSLQSAGITGIIHRAPDRALFNKVVMHIFRHDFHLFWVKPWEWNCWVIWQICMLLKKKMPQCLPKWVGHFAFHQPWMMVPVLHVPNTSLYCAWISSKWMLLSYGVFVADVSLTLNFIKLN